MEEREGGATREKTRSFARRRDANWGDGSFEHTTYAFAKMHEAPDRKGTAPAKVKGVRTQIIMVFFSTPENASSMGIANMPAQKRKGKKRKEPESHDQL